MATKFVLNKTQTLKIIPKDFKKTFEAVTAGVKDDGFFADMNWNKTTKQTFQIKVSSDNFESIQKNTKTKVDSTGGKKSISLDLGYKLKFLESSKKAGAPDAGTTKQQELGTAWIFRRALKDNIKYKSWQDIVKDKKYDELLKIFPTVDEEWLKTFYKQQEKMLDEFSNTKWTEFNRDGGFMEFISNLVKEKFGISKKDTWDPADIWMINGNQQSIEKIIKDTVEGGKSQTINELNEVMRKLFRERKVVGISLKKISGKTAQYEEYNVDDLVLGSGKKYNLEVDVSEIKIDLGLKPTGKTFNTQDSRLIVKGANQVQYNFQIKPNDTKSFANLKYEPSQKGYGAARVGKAPVELVAILFKDKGINFVNKNSNFPRTAEEFTKEEKTYVDMFNSIKGKIDTGSAKDAKTFSENMKLVFLSEPHIANSKLMQLALLSELVKMKKLDLDDFGTDLVFLAAKLGSQFGPFGKLY